MNKAAAHPFLPSLDEATNRAEWHRGLRYTIKDGVIFDTAELLADVRELVRETWAEDVPARFRPRQEAAQ